MLVRLLFASRAVDAGEATLEAILGTARRYNAETGVTGVLCYGNGAFLQVIEGGRSAVNRLLERIRQDRRHTGLEVLLFEEIASRRYASWTMGHVNLEDQNAMFLLKYFESPEFDPYVISAHSLLHMLQELMDSAAVVGRA